MDIITDESTVQTYGKAGNSIIIIGPNPISKNPLFMRFKNMIERGTLVNIRLDDNKSATITASTCNRIKCAGITETYQKLEHLWESVYCAIRKEPLTFQCIYEDYDPYALCNSVYVVTEAKFAYAPKSKAAVFTGKLIDQRDENVYDIKAKVRNLISARERSDHELETLVNSIARETEEENNAQ